MNMNWTPILAMHGHVATRGILLLMVVAMGALIIACWPSKSETK
jgi:hypothetical protein